MYNFFNISQNLVLPVIVFFFKKAKFQNRMMQLNKTNNMLL